MRTVAAFNADAGAISAGVRTAIASVDTLLRQGKATAQTIRHLRAEVQGYLDDIRTLRTNLDLVDVEDLQTADRADDTLALWRWEREVRHTMGSAGYQLRRLWELLRDFEQGSTRTLHTVRSGDTLQRLAARYLGDWREWPRLLDANPGLEAGPLTSGQVLTIPSKA